MPNLREAVEHSVPRDEVIPSVCSSLKRWEALAPGANFYERGFGVVIRHETVCRYFKRDSRRKSEPPLVHIDHLLKIELVTTIEAQTIPTN